MYLMVEETSHKQYYFKTSFIRKNEALINRLLLSCCCYYLRKNNPAIDIRGD